MTSIILQRFSVSIDITLRDYTKADINQLVELANNKKISQYLVDTFPFPYSKSDAEFWIEIGCREQGNVTKVIEYNNEFVGSVGIKPQFSWKSHSAEIGYFVGEMYWGKGIATAALRIMTTLAFETLKFRKLFAPVLAPNTASMHVLEKCGYSLEGILIQEVYKDDQYFDTYQYAKLAKNV